MDILGIIAFSLIVLTGLLYLFISIAIFLGFLFLDEIPPRPRRRGV